MSTFLQRMRRFSERYGATVESRGVAWRYHRLGSGPPLLWLVGGLRRSALGFALFEQLATRYTILAPDYPPVLAAREYVQAFDAMLETERIGRVVVCGQSYGGLLAQVYAAERNARVAGLVLSSTGPANYGRAWLPVEYLAIALARALPERRLKQWLASGLTHAIRTRGHERELREAIDAAMADLTRADVVSHFAVAADWIARDIVNPGAFRSWRADVVVLAAENDPTQGPHERERFERLFGRGIRVVSLGQLGHAAMLTDPDAYAAALESSFSSIEALTKPS